jgi:lambda repressor-like predicted transcriptional regulator
MIFAWTAATLVEGFLISLALQKTIASRILLIPLFAISVIAASASFIVQNEQLLDQFFTQKRVIEQLKTDLSETQKAYRFGERYITRTLQRERALRDELGAIMREKEGDVALINSLIFFLIILVVQSANVYTAMTLKTEISKVSEPEIKSFREVSTETFTETTETSEPEIQKTEKTKTGKPMDETAKKMIVADLKQRRNEGIKLENLAEATGVSKSTLSKVLAYPSYPVSDEIFRKIVGKL